MDIAELYFRPKKWEGTGFIYELLGVLIFKKWVVKIGRLTGQKSTKPNNYYLWQKDKDGIKKYERKTRYNEMMHLIGLLLPILGLIKGVNDNITLAILWFVLLINIHPFLLQRYNRIRIYRILNPEL
jgi:Glycosyl-4,4'-diaponeurosporenoate acyltransferase